MAKRGRPPRKRGRGYDRPGIWSKVVEEAGVAVRIFERARGGALHIARAGDNAKGSRKSLRHRNRKLAEDQAKALARALAEAQLTGAPTGEVTFGQLRALYLRERAPLLREDRRPIVERMLGLWARHLEPGGRPFRMDDFGQHQADTFAAARRAGELAPADPRAMRRTRDGLRPRGARASTVGKELAVLSAACNWATNYRLHGRRLLASNPVRGVRLPPETNPRRPVASADRYRRLLAVADQVDASGQLRLMLALAYLTARRITAITRLRASDLLLTQEQVRRTVAALGMDERAAEAWAQAIRWRAENDKLHFEVVTPIGAELRAEVDRYQRAHPAVGEAWLFPAADPEKATPKNRADQMLRQAEAVAGLGHLIGGCWHPFRRAWASARRHLPVQDVMAAGGWRDAKSLQGAYQHSDPETVLAVVELSETA